MDLPLGYYTTDDKKNLIFHLLDVGEGLMLLLIFPDNLTLLFDCNVTSDNETEILNYLEAVIPYRYDEENNNYSKQLDIFVNSHRDEDQFMSTATYVNLIENQLIEAAKIQHTNSIVLPPFFINVLDNTMPVAFWSFRI